MAPPSPWRTSGRPNTTRVLIEMRPHAAGRQFLNASETAAACNAGTDRHGIECKLISFGKGMKGFLSDLSALNKTDVLVSHHGAGQARALFCLRTAALGTAILVPALALVPFHLLRWLRQLRSLPFHTWHLSVALSSMKPCVHASPQANCMLMPHRSALLEIHPRGFRQAVWWYGMWCEQLALLPVASLDSPSVTTSAHTAPTLRLLQPALGQWWRLASAPDEICEHIRRATVCRLSEGCTSARCRLSPGGRR